MNTKLSWFEDRESREAEVSRSFGFWRSLVFFGLRR